MIDFNGTIDDFSAKLSNDFDSQLTIIFDFVPKGSFDDILLKMSLSEEFNKVCGIEFIHL